MTTIHADELLPGDVVCLAGHAHRVVRVDCQPGWAFPVAFADDGWAIALGHDLLHVDRVRHGRPPVRCSMMSPSDDRPASADDIHEVAAAMPHVTVEWGPQGNAVYQVGGKSFVFFRNPRPDAVDPDTGERYDDVIVIWVESADDKAALVQDPNSPFFTTDHFSGHPSILVRASRLGEVSRSEVTELVQDAWLSRASKRRAADWLGTRGSTP